MRSGGISALLAAVMLLSPLTAAASLSSHAEYYSTTDLFVHDPIEIFGNADLTAENGVTSGSGTEEDPYILEGWDINASDATGIQMSYVSAHVIVRNLHVHGGMGTISFGGIWMDDNEGITLNDVTNLRMEDVQVSYCVSGVNAQGDCDLRIERSEFHGCYVGVKAEDAQNVVISDNVFSECRGTGIHVGESLDALVEGNDIRDCPTGVLIDHYFGEVRIRGNTLAFNEVGLRCDGSSSAVIDGNNIAYNDVAVVIRDSSSIEIRGNLLEENGCGVYILGGWECEVYENDFASNDMQAFEFGGGSNRWFDEDSKTGNHWSDHKGSSPRVITTDVKDSYPVPEDIWQGERLEYEDEPKEGNYTETYQGPFYSSVIDLAGHLGWYRPSRIDMVTGSGGALHAVYGIDGTLRHALRDGDQWTLSALDRITHIRSPVAAMVDSEDHLNVVYISDFDLEGCKQQIMRAAEDDNGTCRLFALGEIDLEYPSGSCVRFDSEGHVYIAYTTRERVAVEDYIVIFEHGISCTHNARGNWTTEVVFNGSDLTPYGLKMEIGDNGDIQLAYFSKGENVTRLEYARGDDDTWSIEEVADFGMEVFMPSACIDLGSSGTPNIAFTNGTYMSYWQYMIDWPNTTLRYAVKTLSGWDIATVVTDGRIGIVLDMVIDSENRPHILYEDRYNSDTMYAELSEESTTNWRVFRLDTSGLSGNEGALAVDDAGTVHILYTSLWEASQFGGGTGEVVYVTTEEPADTTWGDLDVRYVILACVAGAILVAAYVLRRRMA